MMNGNEIFGVEHAVMNIEVEIQCCIHENYIML